MEKVPILNFTSNTNLYCLLGNPISHSRSPIMHNALLSHFNYDGIYLGFDINDIEAAIVGVRELGIRGCSITTPYKVSVIEYLDDVDETAVKIGAVNTIANNKGSLIGYNFDSCGAMSALLEASEIKGKTVVLLGAGGAGKAVGFGIKKNGGDLKIVNRTESIGKRLARHLGADFCTFFDLSKLKVDILINTTPACVFEGNTTMSIPREFLDSDMVVMDIVYNRCDTPLLEAAKEIGCRTVNGLTMLAYQGALQFECWTNLKPSIRFIKKILLNSEI